jgi:hypothetical protein
MPRRSRIDRIPPDIGRWYLATFLGTMCCITLYTVYGFIFVRAHAFRIARQMELLQRFGMIPLISPDDKYINSFIHLLASSLLFGLTLGILNALVCMAMTLPQWITGNLRKRDMLPLLIVPFTAAYLGFSYEMPLVSVICGITCPFVFAIPWLWVLRTGKGTRVNIRQWAMLTGILVVPLVVIALMRPSYVLIRDTMIEMPPVSGLSDIYYNHTLLGADVIKPPASRAQNVFAVSKSIAEIGPVPHGSLWIRTDDPCSLQGADMTVSKKPLKCRGIVLKDSLPANEKRRIFKEYDKEWDLNRNMRNGIGFYYFSGPFPFCIILLASWLGMALVRLFQFSRVAATILLCIYLALFIPVCNTTYLAMYLRTHPEKMREYLDSGKEKKVYLATVESPGALTLDDLKNLMEKGSTRIRINALVEARERRNPALIPAIEQSLRDPRLNVRNKACRALERMAAPEAIPVLERTARSDPSWYVRNSAYYALGTVKPDARVVTPEP